MRRPPFDGDYPVTATKWYPDGTFHGAMDWALPLGTTLYAVADGQVADCSDGVPNNSPGTNPGPGSASNWVLLWTSLLDEHGTFSPVSVYYQHMSPGLRVRRGQNVVGGTTLGGSGNSGNSTGPHLHLAVSEGHTFNPYHYLDDGPAYPYDVYPPSLVWTTTEDDMPLTDADVAKVVEGVFAKIVKDTKTGKEIPLSGALNLWHTYRSTGEIASASAKSTVAALKASGLLAADVDEAAVGAAIAAELAKRLEA